MRKRTVRTAADIDVQSRSRAGKAIAGRRVRIRPSIGLDLISVAEVTAALDRFGDRYVHRVYTDHEATYCQLASGAAASARFAVRFAAKEAAVKALQPDGAWTRWRDIEVHRHKSGRCTLTLRGEAASLARRRGIQHLALSMTHDGDHAAAIVLGWRQTTVLEG
jgi:holo-[acyl-carrier protein] synthase